MGNAGPELAAPAERIRVDTLGGCERPIHERIPREDKTMTTKKNNTENKPAEPVVRDVSKLDAVVKAQAIRAAALFASKDESRAILTSLEIEAARNEWRVVACDSYRLVILDNDVPGPEAVKIHVSAAAASKALKTSDENVQFLEIDEPAKLVKVAIMNKKRNVRLEYWPLIEGQYPDYKKLEPAAAPDVLAAAVSINPEYLASAGKLVNTALGSAPMTIASTSPTKPLSFWAAGDAFRVRGLVMPVRDDELAKKWTNTSTAGEAARIKEAADKARSEGWQEGHRIALEKLEREKNDAAAAAIEAYKEAAKRAEAVNVPPAPKAPADVIAEKLAEDPSRAEKMTAAEKLAALGVEVVNVSGPEPVTIASPEKLAEKLAAEAPADPEPQPEASEPQPAEPQEAPADPSSTDDLEAIRAAFPGLNVTRKMGSGACTWIDGDTKPQREALKAAGFKWSAKKQAWFRKPVAA